MYNPGVRAISGFLSEVASAAAACGWVAGIAEFNWRLKGCGGEGSDSNAEKKRRRTEKKQRKEEKRRRKEKKKRE